MVSLQSIVWVMTAAAVAVVPVSGGLEELARDGRWERLLSVAERRTEQLPLQPHEAFLAAHAARVLGRHDAEIRHLERAVEGGPLQELARLELARAVVAADPERAVGLVMDFLKSAPTREIRGQAVEIVSRGLDLGLSSKTVEQIERSTRYLPRTQRRTLELGLAKGDRAHRSHRLVRLLEASTRDLVALEAAQLLSGDPEIGVDQRYLVAKSFYRHALYDEAEAMFRELDGVRSRKVPSWEVAYLAGRCAFRRGRWAEAAEKYQVALDRRSGSEGRAELGVHLARARELDGRLDLAVEAARRAVVARTTDDRRLFLARLRLRLDQPEQANAGLARLKGRTARARGEMLVALYEIRKGEYGAARNRLEKIRRTSWRGPAAVIAAGLAVDEGDGRGALNGLAAAAGDLDTFWAGRARELIAGLPPEVVGPWRDGLADRLASPDSRTRRVALASWSTLEPDPRILANLQDEVVRLETLQGAEIAPSLPPGLARDLWRIGLPTEALRWDPKGMPRSEAGEALWTAMKFDEYGEPWQAIRTSDGAWRMAGADIPVRAYPMALRRTLHPLPDPDLVWRIAVERSVPWSLMAAVAREESRWRPKVVSFVGARGLMQLMPSTAAAVAVAAGWPEPSLDELFDPSVSLTLGGTEIGRLLSVFDGQRAPAVAAYNAGEAQARLWLDQCATPCRVEWYVANISFSATNRYTRDVIASAETYVDLYGATPRAVADRSLLRGLEVDDSSTAGR
jgi:soluble lytic murein transglycosylase-like protein/tetratricopeptide (TPR) repeat protein